MPSIRELRSALGAFAEDKNDEQLLQLAATTMGVSPGRIASEYGYNPTSSGIAGLRTGAALDQYQAGFYGLGEAVTGADFFRRGRQANDFEANVALERARAQGAIGSFEEVQGLSDVPSYLGGLAIGSAPYALEALGGGLAARGLMSGTRAALGTATAAGDVVGAAQATRALRAGQTAGGVAAAYPSAVGGILQAQREQAGKTDLGTAAALGVPFAALNALGIEGALARQQLARSGISALDNMQGFTGGLARAGATGLRTGLVEGGTETLQEMTTQFGRMAVDPNEAFLSDAALGRYKESAIGGAFLGGALGGATGFGRSEGYQAPMQERDLTQTDTEQKPILGLQYNPLAGTPIIFPDGTVALGSEQEMLARTGIKLPAAAAETDLTAPAGTTTAAAGVTKPTATSIFSETDTALNKLGVKPTKNSRDIYEYMLAENIDPDSPEAEPVINALADSKAGEARKAVGEIIRSRSTRGTGISTVQQPAGGLGVGSSVVQGTVGDAGRVDPVAGTVVGGAPAAGAPLQQTGLLPSTAGQPSTPITLGAPSGDQAPQTIQTAPQGQTTTAVPAAAPIAPNTTLRLPKQENLPTETDIDEITNIDDIDDIVDIARMTGNAGGIDAVLEEKAGLRADQRDFTEADLNDLIEEQLGKGKNKERDRKILRAYILSRRLETEGTKGDLVEEIANTFGITKDRIRQIGNPEKLAKLAVEKGFDRNQVFNMLGIESAQKKVATELGKLEGELTRLKAKAKPSKADTTRMAELDEQITRINDGAESGDMAAAFKAAGIEGEAGEAFGNLDDAREWQKASTAGSQMAVKLVSIADTIAELKTAAAELQQLGLAQAQAAAIARIEELTAEYEAIVAEYEANVIAERAAKLSGKLAKLEKINAVQGESTASVPVQPKAETSTAVVGQVRRVKKPAAESKAPAPAKVLTRAEQAAQAWDVVAADYPQAPKFADLTKDQQNTFIGFGPDNWERGDVELELTKMAKGGMKFGKDAAVAENPYTASELLADIKDFIRADIPKRKLFVVNSVADLLTSTDEKIRAVGAALQLQGAYGVAVDGVAYLVADRIQKGAGRAKFMHEVGAHLGLENLLPKDTYNQLVNQIEQWAGADNGSLESQLAAKAKSRVGYAKTPTADQRNELLAYFVEEAMLAGVDPTASIKESGPLINWFRTLWTAFKIAIRKLGFKPETLTARDVVNMAFGAARLEMNGSWHGTAAQFRKFNHAFMSSGEGAQAYGWGTYLAQSVGIAKAYWSADTARKEKLNVKLEAPAGSLMRLDTAVTDDEMLDWDASFAEQPEVVRNFAKQEIANIKALRDSGINVQIKSGADVLKYLIARFYKDTGLKGPWADAKPELKTRVKEQASKYMQARGIKGIRFFDADSRDSTLDNISFTKNGKTVSGRDGVLNAYFTPGAIVQGYGGPDKVVKYDRVKEVVTVIAVDNNGNPRRGQRERTHSTMPSVGEVSLDMQLRGYDLEESNRTRNLVIFNENDIFRAGSQVGADRQRMKFGKNMPSQGLIDRNIAKLPKQAQKPVNSSINTISDWARQGLDRLVFTSDLINRAVTAGIKSASAFESLLAKRDTKARSLEREVERVADMYATIEEANKGSGLNSVNQFIFESTRTGKWGYDKGSFKADPEMAAQFNALGPKAKAYVEAIFAHGDAMLAAKKKAVLDYATYEYDARIAAETDPLKKAALVRDKANDLKKFASLFRIREGIPYAPIKRFGDHVVIAKSQAYINAVAAKDTKLIRQLEKDPDHYHVSFTETKNEARNLAAELEDQGFFSGGTVAFKERSVADNELFGNSDSLDAITRLRAMADVKAKAGDKGAAQMQRMVSDMYLQALAEGSARKSEMRRRGVSGEIDMLRSFAAQGRADANFVASVEYNPQVQDAIQAMRTEANKGSGDLNRKSEILNEITRRYDSSLDAVPTPNIAKLTRLSSIYYLATSPAYYMQNLTQPWMMSVPAMAGRHDYGKTSTALFTAYGQLGGVMKSARYDQQFDFSKVPADVRDAIQELANRGKIDIGLETELGEFKIEGDGAFSKGWNKVDKFLRVAVQKVEALNRLSTAMAAYRLELAKTGDKEAAINYAGRVLTETHGDYSAFNAPRFFNNPIGKVALQFRKFQLIQLTYYAKLLKDAGFNTEEKRAASKTLAYSLGHTALLAGAMGLPGYSAIAWAIGALFGDDDDPLDVTAELRKFIGDETMANLIMRGAPTLAGVDISGKVGAGNMLSIMPFSNADLTTKAGVIEAVGTLLGGAPVGMIARVADGLGQMLGGEWYKGMEQVLPKGLGDAAKAYRISTEGMSRRNGDIVLPASEVSAWEAVVQGMGIQPVQQSVVMERQQNTLEMNQFYQDRSTKVKAQYIKAIRAGESTAEARDAWAKLQEARVKNGYTRQPLSELLKAPQSQAKRERQVVDGVQFNKANKRFVEEQI